MEDVRKNLSDSFYQKQMSNQSPTPRPDPGPVAGGQGIQKDSGAEEYKERRELGEHVAEMVEKALQVDPLSGPYLAASPRETETIATTRETTLLPLDFEHQNPNQIVEATALLAVGSALAAQALGKFVGQSMDAVAAIPSTLNQAANQGIESLTIGTARASESLNQFIVPKVEALSTGIALAADSASRAANRGLEMVLDAGGAGKRDNVAEQNEAQELQREKQSQQKRDELELRAIAEMRAAAQEKRRQEAQRQAEQQRTSHQSQQASRKQSR